MDLYHDNVNRKKVQRSMEDEKERLNSVLNYSKPFIYFEFVSAQDVQSIVFDCKINLKLLADHFSKREK